MKKPPLFLVFLISLAVCACENPLMANILLRKVITFHSNGGSYVPPQTVLKNERISKPQDPVKEGLFFSGWFTYNGTFYKGWDFNNIPEGDMDLYACWTYEIVNFDIWNFDIKGVGTVIFDENPKEVTVTHNKGTTGNIAIYYKGVNGTEYPKTSNAPTYPGIYTVTFDVELVDGWHLANELEAGTLTIIEKIDSVNNMEDLADLLNMLAANTPDTPYTIPLKVNNLYGIKDTLDDACKYVTLDLSGSIIDKIQPNAFYEEYYYDSELVSSPCYFLTGIIMPYNVKSIGDEAFRGCENLTSVTIGKNVNFIRDRAFQGCRNLTSVIIPASVTSIGNEAFAFCESLTSVTFEGDNTSFVNNNAFPGDLCSVYKPPIADYGMPGTYITNAPNYNSRWTKQPY